jgi:hypothetical protein
MPVFKTGTKEWQVTLDAPTIRSVRKECELNLAALDGAAFDALDKDPCLLVDVLWVICRSQANGMSDADFGRSLVGDAIADATKALTDAWLDFFPAGKRSLLRSLTEKQAALTEKGMALALAKVGNPELEEKLLGAMEARITSDLQKLLTQLNGATNSPESAKSDPKG